MFVTFFNVSQGATRTFGICSLFGRHGGGQGDRSRPRCCQGGQGVGQWKRRGSYHALAFEGRKRAEQAERGFQELQKYGYSHIVISNQQLAITTRDFPMERAFAPTNRGLCDAVQSIVELTQTTGLIN